jgi:hypothetical protein
MSTKRARLSTADATSPEPDLNLEVVEDALPAAELLLRQRAGEAFTAINVSGKKKSLAWMSGLP